MRPALVVRRAANYLDRHDVESPLATAEVLLADTLGTDRTGLYTRSEGLTSAEARRFGRALCRRCTGAPTQHITGLAGFRSITVVVRPGVFVPRPETEVLVEVALEAIVDVPTPIVVDVGTGTGVVALAICTERRDARVLATDLSPEAVALARENAALLGAAVEVLDGDLLAPLPPELVGRIDLVVSNPPYVEPDQFASLPVDVKADPSLALLGGLPVFDRLLGAAARVLGPGGALAVEVGDGQAASVAELAERAGFVDTMVRPDLAGRDRVVLSRQAP